jgi:hypothetical protein
LVRPLRGRRRRHALHGAGRAPGRAAGAGRRARPSRDWNEVETRSGARPSAAATARVVAMHCAR